MRDSGRRREIRCIGRIFSTSSDVGSVFLEKSRLERLNGLTLGHSFLVATAAGARHSPTDVQLAGPVFPPLSFSEPDQRSPVFGRQMVAYDADANGVRIVQTCAGTSGEGVASISTDSRFQLMCGFSASRRRRRRVLLEYNARIRLPAPLARSKGCSRTTRANR